MEARGYTFISIKSMYKCVLPTGLVNLTEVNGFEN